MGTEVVIFVVILKTLRIRRARSGPGSPDGTPEQPDPVSGISIQLPVFK